MTVPITPVPTPSLTPPRRFAGSSWVLRAGQQIWPPLLLGVIVVAAWAIAVPVLDLKPYFLPTPSSVASAFGENWSGIRRAATVTGGNALIGLAIGTLLGITMAFALMRFKLLHELFNPIAIAINAVPIFVVVSVLSKQYSGVSEVPRRLMVTLIVYFVVLVNVAKGLRQVQPTHVELMQSYAASPLTVLRKVRIPNAVGYLFTALKIAAPGAVITAFVSEYFGGAQNGLGSRITSNLSLSKTAAAWAYVGAAILLGLVFYLLSILLENLTSPHRGASPGREGS